MNILLMLVLYTYATMNVYNYTCINSVIDSRSAKGGFRGHTVSFLWNLH